MLPQDLYSDMLNYDLEIIKNTSKSGIFRPPFLF